MVKKIIGEVERTSKAIRRFKNEQLLQFVVTVDLLTAGVDGLAITNIFFPCHSKSRISFKWILERATRLRKDLNAPREKRLLAGLWRGWSLRGPSVSC